MTNWDKNYICKCGKGFRWNDDYQEHRRYCANLAPYEREEIVAPVLPIHTPATPQPAAPDGGQRAAAEELTLDMAVERIGELVRDVDKLNGNWKNELSRRIDAESERDKLRRDLAAARAALATAAQLLPWVSVTERLPEPNTGLRYLVWTQDGGKDIAEYVDRQELAWLTDDGATYLGGYVTYWLDVTGPQVTP